MPRVSTTTVQVTISPATPTAASPSTSKDATRRRRRAEIPTRRARRPHALGSRVERLPRVLVTGKEQARSPRDTAPTAPASAGIPGRRLRRGFNKNPPLGQLLCSAPAQRESRNVIPTLVCTPRCLRNPAHAVAVTTARRGRLRRERFAFEALLCPRPGGPSCLPARRSAALAASPELAPPFSQPGP